MKRTKDGANRPPASGDPADPKKRKPSRMEALLGKEPPTEGEAGEALSEEPERADEVLPSLLEEDEDRRDNGDEVPPGAAPPAQKDSALGPQAVPDSVADEIARLRAAVESLRNEKGELLDRLQRAQAEFENTSKRLTRENG